MKRPLIIAACLFLSGCAAFPFHGSREVAGVRTADALSEAWPADAERFASQAALELSRRYPAGQTGLSLYGPYAPEEALPFFWHSFALQV